MNVGIIIRGSGRKKLPGKRWIARPEITAFELRWCADEVNPDDLLLDAWRERCDRLQTSAAVTLAEFTGVDTPPAWAHHCVEVLREIDGPVELAQLIVNDIKASCRRKWRGYPPERVDFWRSKLVAAKLMGETAELWNRKRHFVYTREGTKIRILDRER